MTLEQLRTRIAELEPAELEAPKRAAVATVLRPRGGELEGLFIRRAEHPDDPWSGHMAFPGGRQDPEDATLLEGVRRHGCRWRVIVASLPGRSDSSTRNRYNRLLREGAPHLPEPLGTGRFQGPPLFLQVPSVLR